VRKGSVSVISPSNKVPAGSSGETQNTRLISSGSQIQGGSLIKTSSNGQNRNTHSQYSNPKNSKGKTTKNHIATHENKLQLNNSKVDAIKNLEKEI
jgi:hypothetical protein